MQPEELLKNIEKSGSFPVTKHTPEEERNSLNKLKAYGLVQRRNKHSWELTSDGHLAIEKGGYKNYLNSLKESKTTHHIENYSVINGDKNIVNQTKESTIENKNKESFWSRFWWLIIIPIFIGILLILIEKKALNF